MAGYIAVPAVGPQFAIRGFPFSTEILTQIPGSLARDCFPSMHVTWAILIAIGIRDRRWKWAFWVFAILMMLATVGGGAHYVIDVIVAIPFTFAVRWAEVQASITKRFRFYAKGKGKQERALSPSLIQ
jgi:membrane-associated phospholipid phosphatase